MLKFLRCGQAKAAEGELWDGSCPRVPALGPQPRSDAQVVLTSKGFPFPGAKPFPGVWRLLLPIAPREPLCRPCSRGPKLGEPGFIFGSRDWGTGTGGPAVVTCALAPCSPRWRPQDGQQCAALHFPSSTCSHPPSPPARFSVTLQCEESVSVPSSLACCALTFIFCLFRSRLVYPKLLVCTHDLILINHKPHAYTISS